jgi:hypothetical protein
MVKINIQELRKELIQVYEKFLLNPKDRENIFKMVELDRLYSGALPHFLDEDISNAISLTGYIIQKELPGGKDKITEAKNILSMLKKVN